MNRLFGSFVFWTVLSIVVLLIFSFFAFFKNRRKRRNYKTMAVLFMLGLYFSNVVFMSSLIYFGNKQTYRTVENGECKEKAIFEKTDSNEFRIKDENRYKRDSFWYGVIYSTKMNGLGVKYQALIPASFYLGNNSGLGNIAGIYFIILTILTPIAFGGLVASFFEGVFVIAKYYLIRNFCDNYYFSTLNEKALVLAKDIHKHQKNSLIIFCNKNKKIDSNLLSEAKYNGFILFSRNEIEFVRLAGKKKYFFIMYDDEIKNISSACSLMKFYSKKAKKISQNKKHLLYEKNTIYLFSENETTFECIDNFQPKDINLIILNRYRAAFYDVLLNKPLYRCLKDGRKDFVITLFGSGSCASEILKACVWVTQLGPEYKTTINVIDKNAVIFGSQLKKNNPELITENYEINFFDCDYTTAALDNLLMEKCLNTNYVIAAGKNDEESFSLGKYLWKFFTELSADYIPAPVINVYLENEKFIESIKGLVTRNEKDRHINPCNININTFGSNKDFYSYSLIVNSDVEKLSINSSCVYWKQREEKNPDDRMPSAFDLQNYYYADREIERGSNRTNGIHLVYKLFLLGYGIIKKSEATVEQIEESKKLLPQLKELLFQNINRSEYETSNHPKAKLARVEHDRWLAYYRSQGWRGIPYEKWKIFKEHFKETKSDGSFKFNQKDYNLKQHVCICPYEKLKAAEDCFGAKYRDFDFYYLKDLIYTIGLEKEETTKINISGLEYVLVSL